jgi:hypothetical protein
VPGEADAGILVGEFADTNLRTQRNALLQCLDAVNRSGPLRKVFEGLGRRTAEEVHVAEQVTAILSGDKTKVVEETT